MNSLETVSPITMTLDEAREALLMLATQQHAQHFRIGQIYNYVVIHKLAEKHAKKSAQQYFSEHVKTLSQTLLSICGSVAHTFTESACARYGVYNLHALLAYTKAANLKPLAEEPGPTPIAVPKEDGTVEEKPFEECTLDEVKQAAKHKRAPASSQPSEEDQARIKALRDSITRYFSKDSSRTCVNARVYQGTTYVTLQDVPVVQLERLAEALVDGIIFARSPA